MCLCGGMEGWRHSGCLYGAKGEQIKRHKPVSVSSLLLFFHLAFFSPLSMNLCAFTLLWTCYTLHTHFKKKKGFCYFFITFYECDLYYTSTKLLANSLEQYKLHSLLFWLLRQLITSKLTAARLLPNSVK